MNNCLRQLRTQYSLTQEVLAEILGVSRQTIISIESNKFNPSLDLAFKISSIFKVPIENFMGNVDEAIQDAFAIPDFSIAAHLAEQYILRMIGGSRITAYLSWVQKIPDRVIYERPYLCAGVAWAYALSWQPDIAERYANAGDKAISCFKPIFSVPEGRQISQDEVWGHLIAIHAHCARISGDLKQSIDYCQKALTQLPQDAYAVRCISSLVLGQLYLGLGELALAYDALTDAFDTACRSDGDNPYAAVAAESLLGSIAVMRGRVEEANQRFEMALEIGTSQKGARLPIPAVGMTYSGLATLQYQRDELTDAAENLGKGLALARLSGNRELLVEILLLQARLAMITDDFVHAEKLLDESGEYLQHQYSTQLIALRGELLLAQGSIEAAGRWLKAHGMTASAVLTDGMQKARFREYLVLARLLLAERRFGEFTVLADRLSTMAEAGQNQIYRIEAALLQAAAYHLQASDEKALGYLKHAVAEAETEGFIRVFMEAGAVVTDLLHLAATEGGASTYTEILLDRFAKERPRLDMILFASSQPLPSERECQVLRLLEEGLNNSEIAERLSISMSTVRSHVKNLQRKLDENNKEQLISRARRIGLL